MVKISSEPQPGRETINHSNPSVSDQGDASSANDGLEPDFKPLTAEEAQAWRQHNPMASPWRVLVLQVVVGGLIAVLTGWVSGQFRLAASVAWGVVAVVMPAVVFVRALSRQMRRSQPGSALVGLFVWELVKIVLTVALLLVAPKVISELSWLALVAGFVVTMKVYWLAMALGWMQQKSKLKFF
jgi:ATP synthase protein I